MGALGISEDVIDPGHKEVEICMYLHIKGSYISHLISLFTIQNFFSCFLWLWTIKVKVKADFQQIKCFRSVHATQKWDFFFFIFLSGQFILDSEVSQQDVKLLIPASLHCLKSILYSNVCPAEKCTKCSSIGITTFCGTDINGCPISTNLTPTSLDTSELD